MKIKKSIIIFLFFIIIMKAFCCEHLIEREGRGKYCSVANVYINDTLPELFSANTN